MDIEQAIRISEKELNRALKNLNFADKRNAPKQDIEAIKTKIEYYAIVTEKLIESNQNK